MQSDRNSSKKDIFMGLLLLLMNHTFKQVDTNTDK